MANWSNDMHDLHEQYQVHEWVEANKDNKELMNQFMNFRLNFIDEEFKETLSAYYKDEDPEEIVDGLIDLCVIAIGTLDLFGVDANKAWNEVLRANKAKQVGVKESRPNPLGLPDLIKPIDWVGPDHSDNTGRLKDLFDV